MTWWRDSNPKIPIWAGNMGHSVSTTCSITWIFGARTPPWASAPGITLEMIPLTLLRMVGCEFVALWWTSGIDTPSNERSKNGRRIIIMTRIMTMMIMIMIIINYSSRSVNEFPFKVMRTSQAGFSYDLPTALSIPRYHLISSKIYTSLNRILDVKPTFQQ